MKKPICPPLPNSAVWYVSDWVMTEHRQKSTTFVPVRAGAAADLLNALRDMLACVYDKERNDETIKAIEAKLKKKNT